MNIYYEGKIERKKEIKRRHPAVEIVVENYVQGVKFFFDFLFIREKINKLNFSDRAKNIYRNFDFLWSDLFHNFSCKLHNSLWLLIFWGGILGCISLGENE